ncbi:hypothetical protein GCM10023203_14030 [Actinomycetospora straminea]|uniref:Uncharacterized protein n=1 Tax=Actinomycetospora straminea TaxID=663607 RepID=A0ABP9E2R5_9PSEU
MTVDYLAGASPAGRAVWSTQCFLPWLRAECTARQLRVFRQHRWAEWLVHSVNVLPRVDAECVVGPEDAERRRIFEALREDPHDRSVRASSVDTRAGSVTAGRSRT